MATKYKYDKDTDYAALMEQAARRGDNAAAAVYEQQRNAKIRGEGMAGQEQTSDYAQYLPIEDVPDYDDAHRREAEALLSERGTVFTREQLLDTIWGYAFDGESRTVDVHVRSLRQKLGPGADCIETVRGIGYKIGGEDL